MCVHPESDGCVAVSQSLGYADNVSAVGDGDRGGSVAEHVGVNLQEFGRYWLMNLR